MSVVLSCEVRKAAQECRRTGRAAFHGIDVAPETVPLHNVRLVFSQGGSTVEPHSDGGSMVSYWAGAWCSQDTFVTAGTTGGCAVPILSRCAARFPPQP